MAERDEQIKQIKETISEKMRNGATDYDEVKEEVFEEFFKKKDITDSKEQEAWKKDFDTYQDRKDEEAEAEQLTRDEQIKGMLDEIGEKMRNGATDYDEVKEEVFEEFFKKKGVTDSKEQEAWRKEFDTYQERQQQRAEKAQEDRDKQIEGILRDIGAKMKAGAIDYKEVEGEVLNEFFTKNKITDPKEQAAWKKDLDTYHQRQAQKNAEKEKTADEANKKSGRKVLGNGVVSKWLSRNKDKLVLATTATLGAAWTASASLSAAGMGGLGLLPTIQVLGVSSTVFPPVLAAGALLVAGYYVKKVLDARKAEKEAAKGKQGNTKNGPLPSSYNKNQGGR